MTSTRTARTGSIVRALAILTRRDPMTDTDRARAFALLSALDPSSRAYEVSAAALTGIRCDPSVWRGGRVTGDGHIDGQAGDQGDSAVAVAPGVMLTLSDAMGDPAAQGRGFWHGTVPTGRAPAPATVRPALATALAMARDERVAMAPTRRALVLAIGAGDVQAESSGRILLTRVADVIGATGGQHTRERQARAALADVRGWVGGMIGRAVRAACTVPPARRTLRPTLTTWSVAYVRTGPQGARVAVRRRLRAPIVTGARIVSVPGPSAPDLPGVSTGRPARTRAQRAAAAARRREARAARLAWLDTLAPGPVTVRQGEPRAVRPHVRPRPVATGRARYVGRILADTPPVWPTPARGARGPRYAVADVSVCGVCHATGPHDDTHGHAHGASGATVSETLAARQARRPAPRVARRRVRPQGDDRAPAGPSSARDVMATLLTA